MAQLHDTLIRGRLNASKIYENGKAIDDKFASKIDLRTTTSALYIDLKSDSDKTLGSVEIPAGTITVGTTITNPTVSVATKTTNITTVNSSDFSVNVSYSETAGSSVSSANLTKAGYISSSIGTRNGNTSGIDAAVTIDSNNVNSKTIYIKAGTLARSVSTTGYTNKITDDLKKMDNGDYLLINEGYYTNSYLSLADMLENFEGLTGTYIEAEGNDILLNEWAYNDAGTKIVGTIPRLVLTTNDNDNGISLNGVFAAAGAKDGNGADIPVNQSYKITSKKYIEYISNTSEGTAETTGYIVAGAAANTAVTLDYTNYMKFNGTSTSNGLELGLNSNAEITRKGWLEAQTLTAHNSKKYLDEINVPNSTTFKSVTTNGTITTLNVSGSGKIGTLSGDHIVVDKLANNITIVDTDSSNKPSISVGGTSGSLRKLTKIDLTSVEITDLNLVSTSLNSKITNLTNAETIETINNNGSITTINNNKTITKITNKDTISQIINEKTIGTISLTENGSKIERLETTLNEGKTTTITAYNIASLILYDSKIIKKLELKNSSSIENLCGAGSVITDGELSEYEISENGHLEYFTNNNTVGVIENNNTIGEFYNNNLTAAFINNHTVGNLSNKGIIRISHYNFDSNLNKDTYGVFNIGAEWNRSPSATGRDSSASTSDNYYNFYDFFGVTNIPINSFRVINAGKAINKTSTTKRPEINIVNFGETSDPLNRTKITFRNLGDGNDNTRWNIMENGSGDLIFDPEEIVAHSLMIGSTEFYYEDWMTWLDLASGTYDRTKVSGKWQLRNRDDGPLLSLVIVDDIISVAYNGKTIKDNATGKPVIAQNYIDSQKTYSFAS